MNLIPAGVAAGGVAAGAGVFAWAAVAPSSQFFGPTIRHTSDSSTLALTFDDGPNPSVTPALLDLLQRHRVPATFFLIGQRVREFPALAKKIAGQGHVVGNHTDTHPNLVFLTPPRIREELARCNDALVAATGRAIRWMRPPYGFRGPQLAGALRRQDENAHIVMWSRAAADWKIQPAEKIIQRLHRVRGGDIVLLHDGDHRVSQGNRMHTVAALEYWLPRWKEVGLRFASLDEILEKKFAG